MLRADWRILTREAPQAPGFYYCTIEPGYPETVVEVVRHGGALNIVSFEPVIPVQVADCPAHTLWSGRIPDSLRADQMELPGVAS